MWWIGWLLWSNSKSSLRMSSDLIVKNGGSTILAETPEIYGAEHLLIERAIDREIVEKLQKQISWWQNYTNMNGATLDGNPSQEIKKVVSQQF